MKQVIKTRQDLDDVYHILEWAPGDIIFLIIYSELGTSHEIPAGIYQYQFCCFLDFLT